MIIISEKFTLDELKIIAEAMFGDIVKAVIDIEREVIALDAELHSDLEAFLLEDGSKQKDLWGINLYPDLSGVDDFVEFDSMINMRPSQSNMTRGVDDMKIQQKIRDIVSKRIIL